MKSIMVFTAFVFISLNLYSQLNSTNINLGVEKQSLDSKKVFVFKPNCLLKIKTKAGEKYFSKNYTLSYKSIVMNKKDTIFFDDILWIKGKVYDHSSDKIFGAITIGIASPVAAFGLLDLVLEGDPGAAIVGILFAGITYTGINLVGARKFRVRQACILKVYDQVKK